MYAHQEVWGTLIALYLFLGGVAGATAAIGLIVDQFAMSSRIVAVRRSDPDKVRGKPTPGSAGKLPAHPIAGGSTEIPATRSLTTNHNQGGSVIGVIAALSSFVIVGVGCVFLLMDLTQPLNTLCFFMNPGSWIFWGIVFIVGMMGFEILYVLPYLKTWPVLGALSRGLAFLKSWQKVTALLGALCGFAVTVYTGFLLSATPAIPFWNTSLLPALFTVSAFSTGLGFLMVALSLAGGMWHVIGRFGKADAGVILLELVALFAFLGVAWYGGRPEAAYSVASLLGNLGFVFGFLLLGILAPLILEGYVLVKGHSGVATLTSSGANLYLLSGLLVLVGGYLLRHYVLWAGFYVKVW